MEKSQVKFKYHKSMLKQQSSICTWLFSTTKFLKFITKLYAFITQNTESNTKHILQFMAVLSHKSFEIKRELYKTLSLQNMCVLEVCSEAGSQQTVTYLSQIRRGDSKRRPDFCHIVWASHSKIQERCTLSSLLT